MEALADDARRLATGFEPQNRSWSTTGFLSHSSGKLTLRRFPGPTLEAYWNARIPGGELGSGLGFWRVLFRR